MLSGVMCSEGCVSLLHNKYVVTTINQTNVEVEIVQMTTAISVGTFISTFIITTNTVDVVCVMFAGSCTSYCQNTS